MGTWGTAIFSDDTALDVKGAYTEEVANGVEGSEATRIVLAGYDLDDSDEGPVVWVALAATQWKMGRLEDEVKAKALEAIDTGDSLERWDEAGPKLVKERKAVLGKLRAQLLSPQPPLKKIRKPFCPPIYLDLQVGDAISYQTQSSNYVIFRCVEQKLDRLYGALPRFDVLDWTGASIPDPSEISSLSFARERAWRSTSVFSLHAYRKRDFPAERVKVVARGLSLPRHKDMSSYWMIGWDEVEEELQKHFRLTPGGPRGIWRWLRR